MTSSSVRPVSQRGLQGVRRGQLLWKACRQSDPGRGTEDQRPRRSGWNPGGRSQNESPSH